MKSIQRESSCPAFDRYRFSVNDDESCSLVDWFCDWFEAAVVDCAQLASGQRLQLGWSLLQIECDGRSLQIRAPDFKSFPLAWSDNLSNALQLLAYHKYVPESYRLQADIPSLEDTALVGERFEQPPMFMTRSDKDADSGHSGWFIASLSSEVDNTDTAKLKMMSLYEVFITAPHVLEYLSMPPGIQVVFETGTPVVFERNRELAPVAGSLVAERQQTAKHV